MKHVRSLLFLSAVAMLFLFGMTSTADAQIGSSFDFSVDSDIGIEILEWDTTAATNSQLIAGANFDSVVVYRFAVYDKNDDASLGATITEFVFHSLCEKAGAVDHIYLYRQFGDPNGTPTGTPTLLGDSAITQDFLMGDPGDFIRFDLSGSPESIIDADGVASPNDTAIYWVCVDIHPTNVVANDTTTATTYNEKYIGVELRGQSVDASGDAGVAPPALTDTLAYTDVAGPWSGYAQIAVNGDDNEGAVVWIDTKPPDLGINYSLLTDADGNGIIDLGDVIRVDMIDTVDGDDDDDGSAARFNLYELDTCVLSMQRFGTSADDYRTDDADAMTTFDVGLLEYDGGGADDTGIRVDWPIPDSVVSSPTDTLGSTIYLKVVARDRQGNARTDSVLITEEVDTRKITFVGDSVWAELHYDANGDGTAAIGDTVRFRGDLTNWPVSEIQSVTMDDDAEWAFGGVKTLTDGGTREYAYKFEIVAGDLDVVADSAASQFKLNAEDDADNVHVDSALAGFPIDNVKPVAGTGAKTITLQYDHDANGIINIGDSIKVTIDSTAMGTSGGTAVSDIGNIAFDSRFLGTAFKWDTVSLGTAPNFTKTYYVADGGTEAVDQGAGAFQGDYRVTDNAANVDSFQTTAAAAAIDTDPPDTVTLAVTNAGNCAVELAWTQEAGEDHAFYEIYWDSGDGWSSADTSYDALGNVIFDDTLATIAAGGAGAKTWSTDGYVTLTHNSTYQFVVRARDNADNAEYNFNTKAILTDCEAPVADIQTPSGVSGGITEDITLTVTTADPEINNVRLYVRDADVGSSLAPGPWVAYSGWVAAGGTSTNLTIDNAGMVGAGFNAGINDTYEAVVAAEDNAGNQQTPEEAADSATAGGGSLFSFQWFQQPLVVTLTSVKDTAVAQTVCGYNVTRDSMNAVKFSVTGLGGATYDMAAVLTTGALEDTLTFVEDISTTSHTFNLNATNLPSGTQTLDIRIKASSGNTGSTGDFNLCVPDEDAPDFIYISSPEDMQYVGKSCVLRDSVQITATVDAASYDAANVSRVEFFEKLASDTAWPTTAFNTDANGAPYQVNWDNCSYNHGDTVMLRAIFIDNDNNMDTTNAITVYIDGLRPSVTISSPDVVTNSCDTTVYYANDEIDLLAVVDTSIYDIDNIKFYYVDADSPDIFSYYTELDPGPDTSGTNTIWKIDDFDTDAELTENKTYRFRAIAEDIAGNVMFDYDNNGEFDDNYFDATANNGDMLIKIDNTPVDAAIAQVVVDSAGTVINTFVTPSTKMGGGGYVYAASGHNIKVHTQTLPPDDTCCYDRVVYTFTPQGGAATTVGVSYGPPPFEISFDPVAMGLIDTEDKADSGVIAVNYVDCLGNIATNVDNVKAIILDQTANPVVFLTPIDSNCVGGDVALTSTALNAYAVEKVKYYYRTAGSQTWNYINESTNSGGSFPVTWNTVGLTDGYYELGAIATDDAGNNSDAVVITVMLNNTRVSATLTEPADGGFIGDTTILRATTDGEPSSIQFQYKLHTGAPGTWATVGTDNFAPWAALMDATAGGLNLNDDYYHLRLVTTNCGGVTWNSDPITVYHDGANPLARLVSVNGYDVENANDSVVDVTDIDLLEVSGVFYDTAGAFNNSGLDKVRFWLHDGVSDVYEIWIDPATAGVTSASFDISGLATGTYTLVATAYDNVGNFTNTTAVNVIVRDNIAPVMAIIGYHDSTLYAYDWSGDADRVLFEYQGAGGDWVGIGVGTPIDLTAGNDSLLWMANWIPKADSSPYTLRCIGIDPDSNRNDAGALTAEFNYSSESVYDFGTNSMTIAAKKNHTNDDLSGITKVTSPNGAPVIVAVYDDMDDDIMYYEGVNIDQHLQSTSTYYGSFTVNSGLEDDYGAGKIFASRPSSGGSDIEIVYTSMMFDEIWPDFGTNGIVYGPDSISLEVPFDAVTAKTTSVMMETWLPKNGIGQDHFTVLPNASGFAYYVGCSNVSGGFPAPGNPKVADDAISMSGSGDCCFENNKYAIIKLHYDPTDDTPAESLVVAWWDDDGSYSTDTNTWVFDEILFPNYVEGFNTEEHYVEFAVPCLHGLYAVVSMRDPGNDTPIETELLGKSFCGYYPTLPEFKLKVEDPLREIDQNTWRIWVDNMPIVNNTDTSNTHQFSYDPVSNILRVYWYDTDFDNDNTHNDTQWEDNLACGAHTLKVGVKNNQGQYEETTFNFTVDCNPPDVVFYNSYVSKNPTIRFKVTDDMSGVDTSLLFVDVIAIESNDTNANNPNQDENLFFLQTFYPEQIMIDDTGGVTIPTTFELEDERAIVCIIYDGTRNTAIGDPTAVNDYDQYYDADHGIHDCVGNVQTPVVQILGIDHDMPTMYVIGYEEDGTTLTSLPGICPVKIKVDDDGDGVASIEIYEDATMISDVEPGSLAEGSYYFDESTSIIHYCPTPGAKIEIIATDNVGNKIIRVFGTGDPSEIVNASMTFNPWDPQMDGVLTISTNFEGTAEIKIYDFGGDLVATRNSNNGSFSWNGMTENGTRVADGIYFGHIKAETTGGVYSTVVKIAIVEKE